MTFQRHSEKQFPIHRDHSDQHNPIHWDQHKHILTMTTGMVTDIIMMLPIVFLVTIIINWRSNAAFSRAQKSPAIQYLKRMTV